MSNRLSMSVFTPRMQEIVEFFRDLGAFKFVGGCVRDLLIGAVPKDYDLITPFTPDEVEAYLISKVGKKKVYTVGKRFGTLGVLVNGEKVEITTYRGEDYTGRKCYECGFLTMKEKCTNILHKEGEEYICGADTYPTRKPEVTYTRNLDVDLQRRDFTINAIALDPYTGKIYDPYNGTADLQDKIIRAVGNPKLRFKEDPLRILRAIRFAARFNSAIEDTTCEKAHKMRFELQRISKERIISEINSMFQLPPNDLHNALVMLWGLEIWQVVLPELQLQYGYNQNNPHHTLTLQGHTMKAVTLTAEWFDGLMQSPEGRVFSHVSSVSRTAFLWAALLHDVAKPFTVKLKAPEKMSVPGECNYHDHDRLGAVMAERFMEYYKFSNADISFIVDTVRNHLKDDCWLRPFDNGAK